MNEAGLADLSDDGVYRYQLARWWVDRPTRWAAWVMLNPSTADASKNDWTIGRCISYSQGWGYDAIVVVNLFALRATNPKLLATHPDPVGPRNDAVISEVVADVAAGGGLIVAAWGEHGKIASRGLRVRYGPLAGRKVFCFGLTRGGHPVHPRGQPDAAPLIELDTAA